MWTEEQKKAFARQVKIIFIWFMIEHLLFFYYTAYFIYAYQANVSIPWGRYVVYVFVLYFLLDSRRKLGILRKALKEQSDKQKNEQ